MAFAGSAIISPIHKPC